MTTEHIHNWNDTCDTRYTCPLQRLQECVCGATRYIEIPDSGIPVVKLSDDELKQYLMEKWKNTGILNKDVSYSPMSVLIESQQKELISDTESRDENNRRMIETYHSLLNNELKQFDESKQYLEFKCSNDQCDVCNYSSHFSLAICSLRYRPNSGCFKCGSKINVSIKTN